MNDAPATLRVEPAGPEHSAGLLALFERASSACHCRYWHFAGDKNAWLDRLANLPSRNQDEMVEALERRTDEMRGVVAIERELIGWLKICPAAGMQKLYTQRLYRGLPCFAGDRAGIFTLACFLVDPNCRRRGVAKALLEGGIAAARSWGARALEAFPRRSASVGAEELWTGPSSVFLDAGFVEVHDFAPYPVVRLNLT